MKWQYPERRPPKANAALPSRRTMRTDIRNRYGKHKLTVFDFITNAPHDNWRFNAAFAKLRMMSLVEPGVHAPLPHGPLR